MRGIHSRVRTTRTRTGSRCHSLFSLPYDEPGWFAFANHRVGDAYVFGAPQCRARLRDCQIKLLRYIRNARTRIAKPSYGVVAFDDARRDAHSSIKSP